MRKFIKVNTVADILGCSTKSVYLMIKSGKIPYIRYSLRNIRVGVDDLEKFIANSVNKEYQREKYDNYNITKFKKERETKSEKLRNGETEC